MKNLNKLFDGNVWDMAGTEQTHRYQVLAASLRGRVGVRHLWDGNVRIRLEPASGIGEKILAKMQKRLASDAGFKQPGDNGENRFSIVMAPGAAADQVISDMLDLLGRGKLTSFTLNEDVSLSTIAGDVAA